MPALFSPAFANGGAPAATAPTTPCLSCGHPAAAVVLFCASCGGQLVVFPKCARCGTPSGAKLQEKTCATCGLAKLPNSVFCNQYGERMT